MEVMAETTTLKRELSESSIKNSQSEDDKNYSDVQEELLESTDMKSKYD